MNCENCKRAEAEPYTFGAATVAMCPCCAAALASSDFEMLSDRYGETAPCEHDFYKDQHDPRCRKCGVTQSGQRYDWAGMPIIPDVAA